MRRLARSLVEIDRLEVDLEGEQEEDEFSRSGCPLMFVGVEEPLELNLLCRDKKLALLAISGLILLLIKVRINVLVV